MDLPTPPRAPAPPVGNAAAITAAAPPLAAQLTALEALTVIGHGFAHLPGAYLELNPVFPDVVTIRLHDDLAGFEQWRTALQIAENDVDHSQRPGARHMTLKATTVFARATVELVAYANPLPTPAETGGDRL